MNKLYTVAFLITFISVLFSFSINPPDGNTGAPGDKLCVQCHDQTNPEQNGTLTLEGFPESITPNETYMLTVVNRLTVDTAVRAGFQVTILGPFNTKAGEMTSPSASSIVSMSAGRQYWDHNPAKAYPDSNVVRWTVNWKAPEMASGSRITWFAAGNIADGNLQSTGDKILTANGFGTVVLSDTKETENKKASVYPNPGSERINIQLADQSRPDGQLYFYDIIGKRVSETEIINGEANIPPISSGVYLLEIKIGNQSHFVRWAMF